MAGGRPRTVSLAPKEMIKLGEEMLTYVTDPKNKVLHIQEWYAIQKGIIYSDWKQFKNKEEFRPYYEKAQAIISKKYIDGTINNSIAQRFLRLYFKDVRDMEDEKSIFEQSIKSQADFAVLEKYEPTMRAFLSQLKSRQDNFNTLEIKPNKDK